MYPAIFCEQPSIKHLLHGFRGNFSCGYFQICWTSPHFLTDHLPPVMKHRHARRARVIFCDLKPPGGSSTQWTLKSYGKGNSFTYTGPGFPAFNVIIEFNFCCTNFDDCCPQLFCNDSSEQQFSFFLSFLADIPTKYLKQTCSFRILLCLNLLSIDDPGTAPSTLLISIFLSIFL